jgi:hypothetical protein
MIDNLLIMRDVARRIGVTPSRMYHAALANEIRATKIGHAWFIDKTDVAAIEAHFKNRVRKKSEHKPHEPKERKVQN